ncbi:MAG: hypothetical protein OS112_05275 [Methanoregula sp.]|nr:MAG: hypothetical protein OS112_05275 [Methanoregula sp.]
MNKFVLPVLGLLFLSGIVSAYQIDISAPETLALGKPLIVTGTTTFGIGTPIDVVLYYQLTTATEIKRKIAYVQSDRTFRVIFDTTTLKKGTYKIEVPADARGDSVTTRLVELVDRTDEIQLSSRQQQQFNGKLSLAGTIKGNQNSGIQIEVTAPDGTRVFGPQYISTDFQGYFSVEVPITQTGIYDASFTDANGFVGTISISVTGEAAIPSPTVTGIPETISTEQKVISAHSPASRDNPAYFEVKSGSGTMSIYTSSRIDWVVEYIDDRGTLHTINENGALNPEEIIIQARGKPIYVKVYPYKYSDSGEVFLYGENAQSVRVSPTIPAGFGAGSLSGTIPPETQKSPMMLFLGIISLMVITGLRNS